MAQLFHRSSNTIARASVVAGVVLVGSGLWLADTVFRSSYFTDVGIPKSQVIQFSHRHHVQGLGLDCRYCHTSVEKAAFAGIPPTETCMTCHSQIWADSPMLQPVRDSYQNNTPLVWERVHDLPDYSYFDHSAHVNNGIGCTTCHGQVDEMPLMWKEHSLYMEWCLDCHRHPEQHLRPRDQIVSVSWEPPADQAVRGMSLAEEYQIKSFINCSTCHR